MSTPPSDAAVRLPEHFGRYTIVKKLGQGGMGAVYLARDTRLDRDVALKVCTLVDNPKALERFRREAKAAAGLRHPNICPVYDHDVHEGTAYITMAFIEGQPLHKWVADHPLNPLEAASAVRTLALAMQKAHEAGVVHRDLKPSNVVVERDGQFIILDFGLARLTEARTQASALGVSGTPSYMSPEQAMGSPDALKPATDVYALGALLYELLTGEPPFVGPMHAVVAQLLATAPKPPRERNPEVPAALETVCLRALEKLPADRFASMQEFADALTRATYGLTVLGAVAKPAPQPRDHATPQTDAAVAHASTMPEWVRADVVATSNDFLKVRCPRCGKVLGVPASAAGKTVLCPNDRTELPVPAGNASPPAADAAPVLAPSRTANPSASVPVPKAPSSPSDPILHPLAAPEPLAPERPIAGEKARNRADGTGPAVFLPKPEAPAPPNAQGVEGVPDASITLLPRTTCPHCWKKFAPEEVLWVASHTDLVGDPRLGPQQMQRFLPTRFDAEGNALDARGFPCQQLACPSCHLAVPAALLEIEPLFVSILGTPACGKSFFLAAMTWELRRVLAAHFGLSLLDTDPVINRILTANQESLFLSPNPDQPFALADLIRKTELQGDLYESVSYGNQDVRYPRPFLFTLQTRNYHPNHKQAAALARVLCLYDNAGEHFHPGGDTTASPGTRHMAHAAFLLFLFDPLQDIRFRQAAAAGRSGVVLAADKPARQETVLLEAASRVRRLLGMPQNAKHQRPLIVVVTKSDAWGHLMPDAAPGDPWVARGHLAGLDTERIAQQSGKLRSLLHHMCPEVVSAAEGFSQEVIYVAVSALGAAPASDAQGVRYIRLRDVQPVWAAVPMLYALSRWMQGVIPRVRRVPHVQPIGDK